MKFRNLADQNSLLISQIKCAQQSLKYTPSKIINLVKVLIIIIICHSLPLHSVGMSFIEFDPSVPFLNQYSPRLPPTFLGDPWSSSVYSLLIRLRLLSSHPGCFPRALPQEVHKLYFLQEWFLQLYLKVRSYCRVADPISPGLSFNLC